MDKKKFESAFKALCIAVGYTFDSKQTEIETLRVYYSVLCKNNFNDDIFEKCVNKMILTWSPEYGKKIPTVKDFLDSAGLSPRLLAEKAHKVIVNKIKMSTGCEDLNLGSEHKHYVAMEAVRRMGGWANACSGGYGSFEDKKNKFISIFEELYFSENINKQPLIGAKKTEIKKWF